MSAGKVVDFAAAREPVGRGMCWDTCQSRGSSHLLPSFPREQARLKPEHPLLPLPSGSASPMLPVHPSVRPVDGLDWLGWGLLLQEMAFVGVLSSSSSWLGLGLIVLQPAALRTHTPLNIEKEGSGYSSGNPNKWKGCM